MSLKSWEMSIGTAEMSVRNAISRIEMVHDNTEIENNLDEVTQYACQAINSIGACLNRIEPSRCGDNETFLNAFKYLANQVKHDCSLGIVAYGYCGSGYPYDYPFDYGSPGFCWNNFKDNSEGASIRFRKLYEQFLMNKNIVTTLNKLMEIFYNLNLEDVLREP